MRNLTLVFLAASVAALALRWWDVSRTSLVALAMMAPVLVLATGVVVALALALTLPVRAPAAVAVALAVTLASGAGVAVAADLSPWRLFARCRPAAALGAEASGRADRIVVYSHNVLWQNGSPAEVARQLAAVDPDVAVLIEAEDDFARAVAERAGGQWQVRGNRVGGTLSMVVLSRWPLTDITEIESHDHNPVLVFTVGHPAGPVRMAGVHTTAPTSAYRVRRWKRELQHLATLDADLLIGDFNASAAHLRFRSLLGAGFVDSHRQVGCGLGLTWTPFPGPSLLHLDHVLVRNRHGDDRAATGPERSLEPVALVRAGRAGSDHRAVVAVVGIDPP